ncbi:MAG TPA: heavy-metal-associated domain-containing protein [Rhizobiales bacterium]|nr:heavy-metal-associated domain-containing protein [Hyphomicrobiales bacterium]
MLKLTVPDMNCGHCVSAVTKAVKGVDAGADVAVDLDARTVTIRSDASADVLAAALSRAGYDSRPAA